MQNGIAEHHAHLWLHRPHAVRLLSDCLFNVQQVLALVQQHAELLLQAQAVYKVVAQRAADRQAAQSAADVQPANSGGTV